MPRKADNASGRAHARACAAVEDMCGVLMEWREGEMSPALERVTTARLRTVRRRMERETMTAAELQVMTALVRVLANTMVVRGASDATWTLAWTTANLGTEMQRAPAP